MGRRVAKGAAMAFAIAALAASLFAPAAFAHVQIVKTNPSGSAKTTQAAVAVLFSGPIRSGTLKVFGPDGSKASKGAGGRDPRNVDRLLVPLKSSLKVGRYTAKAKWTAADGHEQDATFHFRLER